MKNKTLKLFSLLIAVLIFATVVMVIPAAADDRPSLYVTQINKKVEAGCGAIFTKAFTNSNTVKSSEGNFRWTKQIVCKPTDKAGVYELAEDPIGNLKNGANGEPDESIEIPEGGFIYAAHIDDRDTAKQDGTFSRSSDNQKKLGDLKKGDKVTLVGIDIANSKIESNAIIYIGETAGTTTSAPTGNSSAQPKTGDEGILSIAVIAVISLAGASVVSIRRRSR